MAPILRRESSLADADRSYVTRILRSPNAVQRKRFDGGLVRVQKTPSEHSRTGRCHGLGDAEESRT